MMFSKSKRYIQASYYNANECNESLDNFIDTVKILSRNLSRLSLEKREEVLYNIDSLFYLYCEMFDKDLFLSCVRNRLDEFQGKEKWKQIIRSCYSEFGREEK